MSKMPRTRKKLTETVLFLFLLTFFYIFLGLIFVNNKNLCVIGVIRDSYCGFDIMNIIRIK